MSNETRLGWTRSPGSGSTASAESMIACAAVVNLRVEDCVFVSYRQSYTNGNTRRSGISSGLCWVAME